MKKEFKVVSLAAAVIFAASAFMACSNDSSSNDSSSSTTTSATIADSDYIIHAKQTDSKSNFKSCIYFDVKSANTAKTVSFSVISDTKDIDVNFFIKVGDSWTYVKPCVADSTGTLASDQYPKTTTSWQTLYTVTLPASGSAFVANTTCLYPTSDLPNNGPLQRVGFELYNANGAQDVKIGIKGFKVVDQDGNEISLTSLSPAFDTSGYPAQDTQEIYNKAGAKVYPASN